jgi:SEC-C motif-containing protein
MCPCCSGRFYKECCQILHNGKPAPNALALMRSRYAAYANHLPLYIIQTTHPQNPQFQIDKIRWTQQILSFCQQTVFKKLEILDFDDGNSEATVTFIAYLTQKNMNASFQEKSLFKKIKNKWLYHSGIISKPY